jgi:hypothetical protein
LQVRGEEHTGRVGVGLALIAFERLHLIFREQNVHDYGIDAHVEITEGGKPTGSLFAVQVKSGASYFKEQDDSGFIYRADDEHVTYWIQHSLPVILVLCDSEENLVYWQLISDATVETTGAGWRLLVPRNQVVNESSLEKFKQIATRVIPAYRYTVLKQEDVSWGGAKRYSLDVLLNGTLTKAEIAAVVRQVIAEYMGSRYHRNELVERRWGDADAHVIFLFVYLTLDDRRTANWICRSLWIAENLSESQAPARLEGEDIGSSIVTDWSDQYQEMAELWSQLTAKKEDYLRSVTAIVAELKPIMSRIISSLKMERTAGREISARVEELLRVSEPKITELYGDAGRIGLAPVECRDVNGKLQVVVAAAHNLVLPFWGESANGQRNPFLEQMAVEDYKKNLGHLEYELEKVR